MPGLKTTSFGTGDFSWMRNTDGLDEALTGVADISGFTEATHFPDGYLPSGLPVDVSDLDAIVPFVDEAGAVLGFVKGDFKADGSEDVNISFVTRGNINVARLPIAFTPPTTAPQARFFFGS
ncbi:hypothetical protein [Nocardioides bruguierae]|uniref:Phage tail protein n=1 Tax=Nocardioides bruguierae TaxID=2945102 RepID=A0A9X2DBE4_9ACTN|nr:hypothetical protein [Nocardioides bruguierae]MCM0622504.1 hypothetical protein [Nocardioides bruguierae]